MGKRPKRKMTDAQRRAMFARMNDQERGRTQRARTLDSRQTCKNVIDLGELPEPAWKRKIDHHARKPGRMDIVGLDTKGADGVLSEGEIEAILRDVAIRAERETVIKPPKKAPKKTIDEQLTELGLHEGAGTIQLVGYGGSGEIAITSAGYIDRSDFDKYVAVGRKYGRFNGESKSWIFSADQYESVVKELQAAGFEVGYTKTAKKRLINIAEMPEIKITVDPDTGMAHLTGRKSSEVSKILDNRWKYRLQGYQFTPKFKEGKWDGYVHQVRHDGSAPTNLLLSEVDELRGLGYEVIIDDPRKEHVIHKLNLRGIELRDYQREAVEKAIEEGHGVIQAATGAGKTEIGIAVIAEHGQDAVWAAHTADLLKQSEDRIEDRLGVDAGDVAGGKKYDIKRTPGTDINVASIQTINQAVSGKMKDTEKQEAILGMLGDSNVIIFDEAHHVPADTFENVCKKTPAMHKYGLTATPFRDDGKESVLHANLGKITSSITATDLINRGVLLRPEITFVKVPDAYIDPPQGMPPGKRWQYIHKNGIIDNTVRNKMIVDGAEEIHKAGMSQLVLVNEIEHGEVLQKMLGDKNIKTAFLKAKGSKKEEREKIINDLRAGRINTVVATTNLASEGLDIPSLDAIVVADGGKSSVKAMQRVGRALRVGDGTRDHATVLEFDDQSYKLYEHADARKAMYRTEPGFDIKYADSIEKFKP